ncbi:M10 family metallopeptidase C-terminal domain-containing protein [Microvirga pudoricolor]|uniref:M10 family metallopeptidase C-terminal domain-containing protein n=1 Tax=Microvirga pudoricolor TaxID=2778729 RepID=UPI0019523E2B|nr:hypothetical protein [Microvirga pudoricolor]MBM6595531.1 hypothetical protein [Microvirga pudoricolor]
MADKVIYGSDLTGGSFQGSAGEDKLILNGGGDFDLRKITFSGFETISGTASNDWIVLNASQLAGVRAIDAVGTGNSLDFYGDTIDLRSVAVTNFNIVYMNTNNAVLSTKDVRLARVLNGFSAQNDTVIVEGSELIVDDINLLHSRGIDTIRHGSGLISVNRAPTVTGLDEMKRELKSGDRIALDSNADAVISDDFNSIKALSVSIAKKQVWQDYGTIALTATNNIAFSSSVSGSGKVYFKDTYLADFSTSSYYGGSISFSFGTGVSSEAVSALMRSLVINAPTRALAAGDTVVDIDVYGSGYRITKKQIVFGNQNLAPSDVRLMGGYVSHNSVAGSKVGTVEGTDPNDGDTLTYSLIDGSGGRFALNGTNLTLVDPSKISFTIGSSYTVKVRATDSKGAFLDRNLYISVSSQSPVPDNKTIIGSNSPERLSGQSGNDIIRGMGGMDTLSGGLGSDIFVFNTTLSRKNVDTITDFQARIDKIHLDNNVFKKVGPDGALKKGAFQLGKEAKQKDDRIIYDKTKGALYYDADGTGKIGAVKFAELLMKPTIKHGDFMVI